MAKKSLPPEYREKMLARRHRNERLFHVFGVFAVTFALLFLCILLFRIFSIGYPAFLRTEVKIPVSFQSDLLEISSPYDEKKIQAASFYFVTRNAIYSVFPEVTNRTDKKELTRLLSTGAEFFLREYLLTHPEAVNKTVELWVPATSEIDQLHKGSVSAEMDARARLVSDKQLEFYNQLIEKDRIASHFNFDFFTHGDSRAPELAGVGGALIGSFYSLLICFLISFPLGVAAAVYLEEFAGKNWFTEMIEVNINNLAAVPSIIFGLLGLAVILQYFGVPRSTPLAGGIVLSLMTIPTIIIACRASLRAVPSSLREAALAMGASRMQVVFHHVLPLALPGTLTGTIIGLAQALGETAPLLMIGMVAFIVDVPATPLDPAAALPTQIYLWAESAERGFIEKSSAAIIVILLFLGVMNLMAVLLRMRYQRSWQ